MANFAALVLLLAGFIQFAQLALADDPFEQIWKDIVLAKVNYYRALAAADAVAWDEDDFFWGGVYASNCSIEYDPWDIHGRIIFQVGVANGGFLELKNATNLALDKWWEQRKDYNPTSDEYDQLQPFWDTWEFTQMVWASSTTIGCDWSWNQCDPGDDQKAKDMGVKAIYQLVCAMKPAGNKWEQWFANVHCPDCTDVQPQTTTIDPATISWAQVTEAAKAKVKRDHPMLRPRTAEQMAAIDYWKSEVDLLDEKFRNKSFEEIAPHFKMGEYNGAKKMLEEGYIPKTTSDGTDLVDGKALAEKLKAVMS